MICFLDLSNIILPTDKNSVKKDFRLMPCAPEIREAA